MKKLLISSILFLCSNSIIAQNSSHSFYDYFKLFIENGISILVFVVVVVTIIIKPKFLERITSFDAFGVKLQLKDIKESIETTQKEVATIKNQLDNLQEDYIEVSETFDPIAPAAERDKLATSLKRYAAALDNIDFVIEYLDTNQSEDKIFAAACAIQVRPQPKFFPLIVELLEQISKSTQLKNITLKTLYRLVMCLENITRADNSRPEKSVDSKIRINSIKVLNCLKSSSRAQKDLIKNDKKSIVTRIERTIKVIEN